VEAQHRRLQLRDDAVLVVARVADERAAVRPAGNVVRLGVVRVAGQTLAELHAVAVVEVRLVGLAAPVQAVEVKARRAEVDEVLELLGVTWRRRCEVGSSVRSWSTNWPRYA